LELFHRIGDPASAQVRRYVAENGLLEKVRFRNVAFPDAQRDFQARGGGNTPALWDGQVLIEGTDPAIARLRELVSAGGRPP